MARAQWSRPAAPLMCGVRPNSPVQYGWAEVYFYCTPCVHTHWGYGIDNPDNGDVAFTQVTRYDTIWANLVWDVTKSFRLATELTYRTTDYRALPDNEGIGAHFQMQWKF